MLAELRIENLVLIERAHVQLAEGLNAFTGETGAGKSLLVDALGLLFGARGEPDLVRPGAEAAEVSARFLLADAELVEALAQEAGIAFEPAPQDSGAQKGQGHAAPAAPAPHLAELVVSRVLPRAGRARAYANGRPLALPALKALGEQLLDLHGQHENQSLLRPGTRLEILDRFAQAQDERTAVRRAHFEARRAAEALAALRRAARERAGREDLFRFQLKELEEAGLDESDPETLEGELKLLRGAEKIRAAALAAAASLESEGDDEASASILLARSLKALSGIGDGPPEAKALAGRMEGLLAETRDLARDLQDLAEKARGDPERLVRLEDLRAAWRALERKHGRDLEGLRGLREELRRNLSGLGRLEADTAAREAELERAVAALRAAAEKLTRKRRAAARDLERRSATELADLGLNGARLKVELKPYAAGLAEDNGDPRAGSPEPAEARGGLSAEGEGKAESPEAARLLPPDLRATGAEGVELAFSANPELPLKPLSECASGGELSRVMLALKGVLARAGGADRLPVVVFDEVDSGVGGRLGAVLGRKLADLAHVRQVLCVTHLPQVAAYAQRQVKIEKLRTPKSGGGETAVITAQPVEGVRRIAELAFMLRGEAASERTRAEAEEMLRVAQAETAAKSGGARKKRYDL